MRRYLLFSAALYLIVGCLLLAQDQGTSVHVVNLQLFAEWFQYAITVACFIVGGVKLIAGVIQRAHWQILAVSLGVGLSACLVVETLASAILVSGSFTSPVLWLYICVTTASVVPYAGFDSRDAVLMEQIRDMLASHQRQAERGTRQIERRLEEKHP